MHRHLSFGQEGNTRSAISPRRPVTAPQRVQGHGNRQPKTSKTAWKGWEVLRGPREVVKCDLDDRQHRSVETR